MWQVESIAEFLDIAARSSGLHATVLAPDAPELEEVNDQLVGFYASSGRGYLNSPEHCTLDALLGLGRRSRIVTVRDRAGRLVSTVRITPHPFESESLVPHEAHGNAFDGHFELSRLVSWHGDEFRTLSSALVLGTALLHAWSAGALGLVALARTPQRRVFAKFGLKPIHPSPVKVPIRENGDYWFLEAPIASVVAAAHAYTGQLLNAVPLLVPSSTF
ncbi:hypothetical protein WS63_32970 [Burkholderia stagnalis]|nr:hypothetical protein WT74_17755 [Burkholderia stagnalis]KVC62203.1 hypothetical protein WS59_17730 [Burkholderia stagnalis]KVD96471.1 hypothetical protein WS63_32970 [Burkholderia stagnalis]KVN16460.1 hypothetical protein WT10_21895 [Burkholderia stagnalis]KVN78670.1 hypothetical protein WT15_14525 [Burkholderia stagnalis]